ncbi:MAG TPA: acyl-ACP--UDP-N-acetylglucosamine O-acyltransferase [Candidatus Xenobia bacterium]|nr:acyl-ACP--UDP-N-acetylglucosamine O-acyltransferase [Candidatus Xenobia bacterium]
MSIHPTAIVDPQARLAPSVRVGPYAVVGAEVEIGEDTEVGAHAVIEGPIRIGRRNRIFPHAAVGLIPQDLKFKGERSEVIIGDDNRVREFVTIHRGTEGGGAVTRLGSHNLIMAYSHIAHDCQIGDHCILGNAATLAGHVVIEDWAIVGAHSGVHQFCRIGRHAFIGGYTVITQDVLPFSSTVQERDTRVYGINLVGLRRRGFDRERLERLQRAFRLLTQANLNTSQALEQIRASLNQNEDIEALVRFVETSERGIIK